MTEVFGRKVSGMELKDEQKAVLDTFEEYCRRKLPAHRKNWEIEKKFPPLLMKEIGVILGDALISENQEERLDETTSGYLSEIMGRYGMPVPAFLTLHFSKLIPHIRDREKREHYRSMLRNGNLLLCGAFSEPGCGSDSASIRTVALPGNEKFTVNGEKSFVSSPGMANAFMFSARTSGEHGNHRGISLMIAESGIPGLEPYSIDSMATEIEGDFGGVRLQNVELEKNSIIGEIDRGFYLLMDTFNVQRVHVALYSLGIAEASLEEAIEYSRMRNAFGNPISKYQAVSFRIAENWVRVEASRLLAFRALSSGNSSEENSLYGAATKWYACENAFHAVDDSLQTLGASGYVRTSDMERRFRMSRGFLIGDGTPDIQKLIISRSLLGRDAAP